MTGLHHYHRSSLGEVAVITYLPLVDTVHVVVFLACLATGSRLMFADGIPEFAAYSSIMLTLCSNLVL